MLELPSPEREAMLTWNEGEAYSPWLTHHSLSYASFLHPIFVRVPIWSPLYDSGEVFPQQAQ